MYECGKESACNAGDLGSISGLGRSPGEGKGYLLQYSGLENSMEPKSWTCLSDFHFYFRFQNADSRRNYNIFHFLTAYSII